MHVESRQTKSCLQVLHLEDDPLDAELIKHELERHNIPCSITRIHTQEEFKQALDAGEVDLILSDSNLPCVDTVTALKMTRKRRPELPFVFVTGSASPHIRKEAIREGATEFISKDNLPRLVKVVNWMRSPHPDARPHRLLPQTGTPAMVQCRSFRCLGYVDKAGVWRDYPGGGELPEVLDWWEI